MKTYRLALALCAIAAFALLVAGTRPWTAEGQRGDEVAGLLASLPLVAAAGIAGLIATADRQRQLVGIILLAAPLFGLGEWFFATPAFGDATMQWWPWPLLSIAGALAMVASGALAVTAGHEWPRLGTKYDRQETQAGRSDWQRLDDGDDPTL